MNFRNFFFFQAEDGIRDVAVTGVQTCALPIFIVDEPTAGLDPEERVRFLNLLSEIGEASAVILSTHIVEDVEELCSNLAIIDRGEILLAGSPARVIAELRGRIWRRSVTREELPALEQ